MLRASLYGALLCAFTLYSSIPFPFLSPLLATALAFLLHPRWPTIVGVGALVALFWGPPSTWGMTTFDNMFAGWLTAHWHGGPVALVLSVGLGGALGYGLRNRDPRRVAAVVATLLLLNFLILPLRIFPGMARMSLQEPGERYISDARMYLKTYYLMRRGVPYYPAYHAAYVYRYGETPDHNRLGIRPPALNWLWSWAPGAEWLYGGYQVFSLVTCLAGFGLAWRLSGPLPALLSLAALSSWFAYGSLTPTWSNHEQWAMFCALPAVYLAWVHGHNRAGAALFGLGATFREWTALAMLGPVAASRNKAWIASFLLVCGYMTFHVAQLWIRYPANVPQMERTLGGPKFVLDTLNYSTDLFAGRPWVAWLTVLLAGWGFTKLERSAKVLFAGLLLPLAASFVLGYGGAYYWGGNSLPWLFVLASLAVKPRE